MDRAIVFCENYNGHEAYFMMKKSDFRYNTTQYKHVADIDSISNKVAYTSQGLFQIFPD